MPDRSDEFRKAAADCLARARNTVDPVTRANLLTLAQKWDLTANELARNVHTHPTMSEALQECFHGLTGHMINF